MRDGNGKSIGSNVDNNFQAIQSYFNNLKNRYHELGTELKDLKGLLHNRKCYPCYISRVVKVGDREACDCTNLEPRKDCLEFYQMGVKKDGIYKISMGKFASMTVFCDQTSNGGGWTVMQRRIDGSVDFIRNWAEYRDGFGRIDGEIWLGNDKIHELTKISITPKSSTLLIDMKIKGKTKPVYAKYTSFYIDDESKKFMLHIDGFSGNITDKQYHMDYNNNMKFSTYDQDNDNNSGNCAISYNGWWADNCSYVYLNGAYGSFLSWYKTGTITFSEMKVRRNL